MPEVLKKSSKIGDRFTTTSDLQNNVERVSFQAGNRQLNQKFPEKAYCPQVHLRIRNITFPAAFHAIQAGADPARS